MKTTSRLIMTSLASLFIIACNNDAYKTNDNGLKYKIHTATEGKKPSVGDILTMNMIYKTSKDSILFNTFTKGKPVTTPLTEPSFKGGIEEGFAMLAAGDSGSFIVPADSLFMKTFGAHKLPSYIDSGSMITFIVKMESFKTKQEVEDEKKAMNEKNKNEESDKINNYLKQNNITSSPTASGIYYIETLAGKGPKAESGKNVSVKYTGRFLDGKIFDSSDQTGKPLDFVIGNKMVIDGWEEGIALMKKGGKATILIPSLMAYGERGAQNPQSGEYIIPPFTPLVFEVELVDVSDQK